MLLGIRTEIIVRETLWLITKGHGTFPIRTLSRFLASEIEKLSVVGLLMSIIKLPTDWTRGSSGSKSWNGRVNVEWDPSFKRMDTVALTADEHGDAGGLHPEASPMEKRGSLARTIDPPVSKEFSIEETVADLDENDTLAS